MRWSVVLPFVAKALEIKHITKDHTYIHIYICLCVVPFFFKPDKGCVLFEFFHEVL